MSRADYQRYLESAAWRTLREAARYRARGQCELCGGTPEHVHHVRYPREWAQDSIDNLIVLCAKCHEKSHGLRRREMKNGIFDGVEFVLDIDGDPAYRFEDVFRRLHGDVSRVYNDVVKLKEGKLGSQSVFNESTMLARAWGLLHDFHKAKVDRSEYYLTEAGVYKLAGDLDSPECIDFMRWRDTEVLPSIRKTGSYSSKAYAFESTGDEHADLAFLIATQAQALGHAILEAREGKRIALEVDAKVTQLDAQVSSAIDSLNNLTGGDFYKTAARFMSECHVKGQLRPGILPDEANVRLLGKEATRLSRVYNKALGPEVIHGRFPVNSYAPDVLEQAACLCGFLNRGSSKT